MSKRGNHSCITQSALRTVRCLLIIKGIMKFSIIFLNQKIASVTATNFMNDAIEENDARFYANAFSKALYWLSQVEDEEAHF